jgi:hypothetical protein
MDSWNCMRSPPGVHQESIRSLSGVHTLYQESIRSPSGVHQEFIRSIRTPDGLHQEAWGSVSYRQIETINISCFILFHLDLVLTGHDELRTVPILPCSFLHVLHGYADLEMFIFGSASRLVKYSISKHGIIIWRLGIKLLINVDMWCFFLHQCQVVG